MTKGKGSPKRLSDILDFRRSLAPLVEVRNGDAGAPSILDGLTVGANGVPPMSVICRGCERLCWALCNAAPSVCTEFVTVQVVGSDTALIACEAGSKLEGEDWACGVDRRCGDFERETGDCLASTDRGIVPEATELFWYWACLNE